MLTAPLYHGTSSIFLDSIRRHGLGGHDPVAEWNAVSCLDALRNLACSHLARSDWWLVASVSIEQMCLQSVTSGGFNFRHGTTYLSPSELTAVRYALTNRYGSELLSTCAELYQRLEPAALNPLQQAVDPYPWLPKLLQGPPPTPILVRAERVPLALIRPEGNRSMAETLSFIEKCRELGEACLQQFNFQLREPLTRGLTFFKISRTGGHAAIPEYDLEEISSDDAA